MAVEPVEREDICPVCRTVAHRGSCLDAALDVKRGLSMIDDYGEKPTK